MSSPRPDAAQIRGALGLLRWENRDLAKACNVSAQSISNIKNGTTRPHPRILSAIKRVLEFQGIKFTENSGVRFKSNEVEIYEGVERFEEFTHFLYEHLKQYGGDVCLSAVDESLFMKYRKESELQFHRSRMQELVDRGDVTFRLLANRCTYFTPYAQYRWQAPQSAAPTAFYAFGDCLALISFAHDPAPYVVLHKSGPFTESYRHVFNTIWESAPPLKRDTSDD